MSPLKAVRLYSSHPCSIIPENTSQVHTTYGGANLSAFGARRLMNTEESVLWELNLLRSPPTTSCLLQITLHRSLSSVGYGESHNFYKVL